MWSTVVWGCVQICPVYCDHYSKVIIVLYDALTLNMGQANIWTNDDPVKAKKSLAKSNIDGLN